jgi:cytochrome c-type biogenesis protein CcmH
MTAPIFAFGTFAMLAVAAGAFAATPVLRSGGFRSKAALLLAGAIATAIIGVGAGLYIAVGRPAFALRAFEPPEKQDLGGLISLLVTRVHQHPDDATSWMWLGRAYETAGDLDDGARALSRAVAVAQAHHALSPKLLTEYGEALVRASQGEVSPEARSVFAALLKNDPKSLEARYFLGYAYAEQGEAAQAIALWQSLIADLPQNTALRGELTDKIAALSAKSGGTTPDIAQMVQNLSERLKAQPDDPEGWQRLIRAYSVLGQRDKAQDALDRARVALAKRSDALRVLDEETKELKLR